MTSSVTMPRRTMRVLMDACTRRFRKRRPARTKGSVSSCVRSGLLGPDVGAADHRGPVRAVGCDLRDELLYRTAQDFDAVLKEPRLHGGVGQGLLQRAVKG